MKLIAFVLFFFCIRAYSQDSHWIDKQINEMLSLKIPSNFQTSRISFIQQLSGEMSGNDYLFRFYDTTMKVEDEEDFKISLLGYVKGILMDSSVANYRVNINDTTIGGTKGLFVKLNARDTQSTPSQLYFYVTMANKHFYSFNVMGAGPIEKDPNAIMFFQSILFDPKKVPENIYSLNFTYEN